MLVIGLTGGIGSGKTTVAERFKTLNVPVIDADEIARDVVRPGEIGYNRIVAAFGYAVLDAQRAIDRARLRSLVFSDTDRRKQLEDILHPLIRAEMQRRVAAIHAPYCILVIPLLIETQQTDLVDRILVVDVPPEIQVNRAQQRDRVSAEAIQAVMQTQTDRATRLAAANDVIINDQNRAALYEQVDALHARFLKLVGETVKRPEVSQPTSASVAEQGANVASDQIRQMPLLNESRAAENVKHSANSVIYELPLNEKVRTFLRLESLFNQLEHFYTNESQYDSRIVVSLVLELSALFTTRTEFKAEMRKEVERISNALRRFMDFDGVNKKRLSGVMADLSALDQELVAFNGKLGQGLKDDEFLFSVKQRATVSGGLTSFDLPLYHQWLQRPYAVRKLEMERWMREFDLTRRTVNYLLKLIRNSTTPINAMAKNGFYQQTLDPTSTFHLIRIFMPIDSANFPEISGGRQRISVHFMSVNGAARPVQAKSDVAFDIACCAL
ncbi:MAG: cell division protein ZapD [Gammaproteobacteria bacterium]|nr:cell division protein ZapD [Gammaproteobacteria bacterium]